jgi:hypothetical protein
MLYLKAAVGHLECSLRKVVLKTSSEKYDDDECSLSIFKNDITNILRCGQLKNCENLNILVYVD